MYTRMTRHVTFACIRVRHMHEASHSVNVRAHQQEFQYIRDLKFKVTAESLRFDIGRTVGILSGL